jgi:hypothetical protein
MSMGSASQRWAAIGVVGLLSAVVIASFALAGVGARKPLVLGVHTVTLTLSEYSITPQSVSLPAGPIRVIAQNRGIIAHNLTISDERLDSAGERVVIASTHTILPGASRVVSIAGARPGRYAMASTLSNQADLGMTGTLIVR